MLVTMPPYMKRRRGRKIAFLVVDEEVWIWYLNLEVLGRYSEC